MHSLLISVEVFSHCPMHAFNQIPSQGNFLLLLSCFFAVGWLTTALLTCLRVGPLTSLERNAGYLPTLVMMLFTSPLSFPWLCSCLPNTVSANSQGKRWMFYRGAMKPNAATDKEIPGSHGPTEPLKCIVKRKVMKSIYKHGNSFKGPTRLKLLTNYKGSSL